MQQAIVASEPAMWFQKAIMMLFRLGWIRVLCAVATVVTPVHQPQALTLAWEDFLAEVLSAAELVLAAEASAAVVVEAQLVAVAACLAHEDFAYCLSEVSQPRLQSDRQTTTMMSVPANSLTLNPLFRCS